jgi:hypothetical protein
LPIATVDGGSTGFTSAMGSAIRATSVASLVTTFSCSAAVVAVDETALSIDVMPTERASAAEGDSIDGPRAADIVPALSASTGDAICDAATADSPTCGAATACAAIGDTAIGDTAAGGATAVVESRPPGGLTGCGGRR